MRSASKFARCMWVIVALCVANAARADVVLERGAYLVKAGNCESCHTRSDGKPLAGGRAFTTPFGTIHSSNISSDLDTGIGKWTRADLRRAMHEGVAPGGKQLFPAFPYPYFTKVSDEDVDAIFAFLRSIPAVRYRPPENDWPFRQRWAMRFWNAVYFKPGRYVAAPEQSSEWNRGAYLVESLGHCGACHTPRDAFMGQAPEFAFAGGMVSGEVTELASRPWAAVNLTSSESGLAAWSVEQLTKYVHVGFSQRAGAFGPMNDVIANSTRHLSQSDARAIAVYIKSLPARDLGKQTERAATSDLGALVYSERCEKCHGSSGRGGMFTGPPLQQSATVRAESPASLINAIIYGAEPPEGISLGAWESMKPLGDVLSDDEIAAVANQVRSSWGNSAPKVTAADVAKQR